MTLEINAINLIKKLLAKSQGKSNKFKAVSQASNAVGSVGDKNYSIEKEPFIVQECDQVIQITGKRMMDMNDYSIRKDNFMTLSIYFANFFKSEDTSQLVESLRTTDLTQVPKPIYGAPGCTMFVTESRSFSQCFDTVKIMEEIIESVKLFFECIRNPLKNKKRNGLENCDFSKLDLSLNGPFGEAGPIIAEFYRKKAEEERNTYKLYSGSMYTGP